MAPQLREGLLDPTIAPEVSAVAAYVFVFVCNLGLIVTFFVLAQGVPTDKKAELVDHTTVTPEDLVGSKLSIQWWSKK